MSVWMLENSKITIAKIVDTHIIILLLLLELGLLLIK